MKTLIGIFTEIDKNRTTSLLYPYVEAIESTGGVPLVIPFSSEVSVSALIDTCDGFLFAGGADISPDRYGGTLCEDLQPYRDELEFYAFEKIFDTDKPILAICRGAQLINVALGGTLYGDIPTEIPSHIRHRQTEDFYDFSHEVNVLENTPLRTITKKARIKANSFHHQAIRTLGNGLKVSALADDGIIEAIYLDTDRYLRGYQWHPERIFKENEDNESIFQDFIKNCEKGMAEVKNEEI